MIVVVSSLYDETARTLVDRWQPHDAVLLTCEDLSASGWCYYLGTSQVSTAVIGGRKVAMEEISGVLTRLPGVFEQELLHIIPADRAYVATEMTSFLLAWLSGLPCPVLNRPTPLCLSGPYWRHEQWLYAAAQVGIPIRPTRRKITREIGSVPETPTLNPFTVTVVGERCFGAVNKALTIQAQQLAEAANVDLLAVQFSGPEPDSFFISATVWPDITTDDVADAVINYFQRHRSR